MGRRLGSMVLVNEALNGAPGFSQNVSVSTTSARNATAFDGGEILLLVNDGADKCFFKLGDSTVAATTTDSVPLNIDEKIIVTLKGAQTHVAFIADASTTTVRIFVME